MYLDAPPYRKRHPCCQLKGEGLHELGFAVLRSGTTFFHLGRHRRPSCLQPQAPSSSQPAKAVAALRLHSCHQNSKAHDLAAVLEVPACLVLRSSYRQLQFANMSVDTSAFGLQFRLKLQARRSDFTMPYNNAKKRLSPRATRNPELHLCASSSQSLDLSK